MPNRVLLFQSNPTTAHALNDYFSKRGDPVWLATELRQAEAILKKEDPDLVLIDLHQAGSEWLDLLSKVLGRRPKTRVIITNRHPDYRRELIARERGARVFLRAPFTPDWIERALQKLEQGEGDRSVAAPISGTLPRVRMPMRLKITFPYAVLALIFAIAASFLISRYVLESLQDRFTSQLIDMGKLSSDWLVQEESRLLETIRLLANTEGVPELILNRDSSRLQEIALPVAINYQDETVQLLNLQGESLLTLVHKPGGQIEEYTATQGDRSLAGLEFVQKVIRQQVDQVGNKYAGLWQGPDGPYFAISGPVFDEQGKLAGVIVVGNSLTTLSSGIRSDTLAQVTFYSLDGTPVASTLSTSGEVATLPKELLTATLEHQDRQSSMRDIKVASASYTEILGPLEARGGTDLGLVGASLAQNFLSRPSSLARYQVILFVILAFLGIIALGMFLANQITYPLSKIVAASVEVARGNLEVKVPSRGNDEVMVLAHAFNSMVSGLQEGSVYRDLLGRTVSPEVREALKRSFASGDLRLEGQNATAAVLMSDIRGFTSISEKESPTTILNWLNEYFGELVPVVASHGGVVDKFEGDAMLAFFGILPTPLPAQDSAYHACQAAVEMLEVIDRINARRSSRGEPPLITGISVNSGNLTAGSLGNSDRLNYTIIGDTVNTAQRIGEVTRQFGESGVVISKNTFDALAGLQGNYNFEPLGGHTFKGKKEPVSLYRLFPFSPIRGRAKPQ